MGALIMLAVWIVSICAWITHVIECIDAEKWLFLIGGALCVPIAVVHGVGIWFGAW